MDFTIQSIHHSSSNMPASQSPKTYKSSRVVQSPGPYDTTGIVMTHFTEPREFSQEWVEKWDYREDRHQKLLVHQLDPPQLDLTQDWQVRLFDIKLWMADTEAAYKRECRARQVEIDKKAFELEKQRQKEKQEEEERERQKEREKVSAN